MPKPLIIFILSTIVLSSCNQNTSSTTRVTEPETVSSLRRYTYTDSAGGRLIVFNSLPRGNGYTGADGQRHPYVVFYTQLTNLTASPVEIQMDAPLDSLEFPRSSGVFMKLFLPSDTMTADQVTSIDYGLSIKRVLDDSAQGRHSLRRTIAPRDSTAMYVVLTSDTGVGGVIRTGLRVEGQDLMYRISAYKSVSGHPLLDEQELKLGTIRLRRTLWP